MKSDDLGSTSKDNQKENSAKPDKKEATRKSSQRCLEFFSNKVSNFLGGSADLTSSNLTKISSSKING